jgi:hypothetical protein
MTYKTHWLGLVLLVSLAAHADTLADARTRYADDMAACTHLMDSDDLKTCRLEAKNALAEAKRQQLDDTPDAAYSNNYNQRCDVHTGDERAACEARMRGEGSTQGSVAEGGILRETVRPMPKQ